VSAEEFVPAVERVTYVFGPFRLDAARRTLYAGSMPTVMPERLFQILLMLIQAEGRLVARDALAERVWGDEGVTDTNVNQHIYLLRLLLGEQKGERSYIVTVPGEGYRFAATVRVAPTEEERYADVAFSRHGTLDARDEALQAYCRGCYLLDRRDAHSLTVAADAFQEALRAHEEYVPALIGLARAQALLAEYWHVHPALAFARAKLAIERALRLEPRSSMAHAVLSEIQLFCDWNWSESRRSITTAMTLNPNSSFARNNATWYYICRGDFGEALDEARQALILEPASLPLQLLQARALVHAGEYAAAIVDMTNILLADPDYYLARRYRAQAFLLNGEPARAVEDLTAARAPSSEDLSFRLPLLARAYAALGDPRAAQLYEQMKLRCSTEYIPFWNLAIVAVGLGRSEDAVRYLQSALREKEPTLLFLRTLPWFESVKSRSEFRKVMAAVGP
jgi:DNA-binding winged helix-turn-helix (wHTH) protein/Tfp pilus assembly protein PilF